ncbi:hypothetical protein VTJ04DRAFT_8823 [Mycothermus thermophilus]|uniref:uncharacterized protein n=1 Tax=Humicola insolens TaxID=85995 RepID=UPI0037441881
MNKQKKQKAWCDVMCHGWLVGWLVLVGAGWECCHRQRVTGNGKAGDGEKGGSGREGKTGRRGALCQRRHDESRRQMTTKSMTTTTVDTYGWTDRRTDGWTIHASYYDHYLPTYPRYPILPNSQHLCSSSFSPSSPRPPLLLVDLLRAYLPGHLPYPFFSLWVAGYGVMVYRHRWVISGWEALY